MTRKETIAGMVAVYECAVISGGRRLSDHPISRPRWMSAVLDFLTKETVKTRRSLSYRHDDYAAAFSPQYDGPKVELIILDLPEAPSVTSRAAKLLRRVADGATKWNFSADDLRAAADELRAAADELEKEAGE